MGAYFRGPVTTVDPQDLRFNGAEQLNILENRARQPNP